MEKFSRFNFVYQSDIDKFKEWSAHLCNEAERLSPYSFSSVAKFWTDIRSTPGLQDELDFIVDIYDKFDMGIEFINLFHVPPYQISLPRLIKYRRDGLAPVSTFDPDAVNRNCILYLPFDNVGAESSIQWVSKDEVITDLDLLKSRAYKIEETTKVENHMLLLRGDQPVVYNNVGNKNFWRFLLVGFEGNPTYDEIKSLYQAHLPSRTSFRKLNPKP